MENSITLYFNELHPHSAHGWIIFILFAYYAILIMIYDNKKDVLIR